MGYVEMADTMDAPEVAGTRYVSRIAGLPGEKIEIIDKTLFVNGSPTDPPPGAGPYVGRLEKYFLGGNGVEGAPMTLGPDKYFVLGDNSPRAADSRYWREAVAGYLAGRP